MGKIVIEKFIIDRHFTPYAEFAKKMFGSDSYQASKNYLYWLQDNTDQTFVAIEPEQGRVVGFISTMSTKWEIDGEIRSLIVPHNFMVVPEFRHGVGVGLFFKIFKKDGYLFAPGVVGEMRSFYEKLGATLVPTVQYRKVLRPIFGGVKLLAAKFMTMHFAASYFDLHIGKEFNYRGDAKIDFFPDDVLINKLVLLWNGYVTGFIAQHFENEYFKWRFFHPRGPRHLLVYLGKKNNLTDFMIISLGPRKGVNVARAIMVVANSSEALRQLLLCAESVLKQCGADVILSVHADPDLNQLYAAIGWKPVKSYVDMYVYLAGKRVNLSSLKLHAAAGDYGFESISQDLPT